MCLCIFEKALRIAIVNIVEESERWRNTEIPDQRVKYLVKAYDKIKIDSYMF